uniref:PilZ domain-containing protein n=1 Tax=Muricoccus nepalensis TaxID=1854500 RepID=UPI001386B187
MEIRDASRGGAALASAWEPAPGTPLEMAVPGLDGTLPARVVRSGNGAVAIAFRQDTTSMGLADRMLERIAGPPLAA